jgi:TPP-dependent pyruvate/acetoin dehydrogenase alpha subunit
MSLNYKNLYERMFLIRSFEFLLLKLFEEGKLFGTTHTYVGQEAIAVSVMEYLNDEDIVFSNHRCHGHYLAKENDPEGLLAEIMGREEGVCGGRGGSQHLQKNNFYSNGIQGGIVANSLGMAFSEKYIKSDNIVVVFIGDGTWGEGIVYESLNMASLWEVPLLMVVENNGYAQSTPFKTNLAGSIIERVRSFNIKADEVESNDVNILCPKFEKAISFVRKNQKPFVQIVNTYRLEAHSKGDDDRPKEEVEENWKNEPLQFIKPSLKSIEIESIEKSIHKKLNEILKKVENMNFASFSK